MPSRAARQATLSPEPTSPSWSGPRIEMLPALPVTQLRSLADDLARQIREIDMRVQQSNWEVDLLD